MLLKQKWACIVFILALCPVTAYSQGGFYELPTGETGFGLGFSTQEEGRTIEASLDYAIDKHSKFSFYAGIGFIDNGELTAFGGDIPPSPGGGINLLHVKPLGDTGIEYFFRGDFGAAFAWVVEEATNETLARSRALGLSGSTGILKRLGTESEWVINPFFAVSYTNFWTTIETPPWDFEETESASNFSGEVGVEIEMSPTVSAIGVFAFSFESSDTAFRIGLNFH